MTNPWSESAKKDVLYPDDLEDVGVMSIISEEPIDADDVDEPLAGRGQWALVENGDGEIWAATPVKVRELIGEAFEVWNAEGHDGPPRIEIVSIEEGEQDHDPYRVEGRVVEPGEPL